MTMTPAAVWRGETPFTSSFTHRHFRALWASGLCSSVGQWTLLTARAAYAHQLSGGSASVGLVVFASMLPNVFMPPIGGVLADRFNRRTVVSCALTVSVLSALLMAVLIILGVATVGHLFLLSLVNGMSRAVEIPSTQAMVPALAPGEELLNAVALTGVVTHGSRLVGPVVTLLTFGPLGAGASFVAGAALYGAGLLLIQRVPRPEQYAHPAGENPLRQLADGVRYAATEPLVGMILLLVLFHCALTMSYDALMPMFADEHMGHGEGMYSVLMSAVGVGSLIGTVILAGRSLRLHRGRLLLATGLVSGLSPAALAMAMHWSPALVAAAAMGASQATFMSLTNAALQTATPDRYRGRVLSLYLMIGGGIMAFGNLATGYLADNYGTLPTLALPAVAFTAVIALSLGGSTLRAVYGRRTLPVAAH